MIKMKYIPPEIKISTENGPLDGCLYRKDIDIPYAIEIVSELYGDVIPLLDKHSLVYGGIIRDIIAGMFPLVGDLDIIASRRSYLPTVKRFKSCNKIDKQLNHTGTKSYSELVSIGSVSNFKTRGGNSIQLIKATGKISDVLNTTDLVCCGVVMTNCGKVFEVVHGAEEACDRRILTLNTNGKIRHKEVEERVNKLVKRGWKSEVDMSEVKKLENLPPQQAAMPQNQRFGNG